LFRFILTVLLAMAVLSGGVVLFVSEPPSFFFPTSFFLTFTTVITYTYLQRTRNPAVFVRLYLGMIALKLMVCLGYAVLMATYDPAGVKSNILYFLVIYVVLTGVEVGFLYRDRNR
jgi:hypothetical protein